MFLNSKQEKAIEFVITVLESRGLTVRYPEIEGEGDSKTNISRICWRAVDKMANPKAHILLTKWNGKFKLVVWLPKNPDEGMSAIDPYVVLDESKTHLILPYGQGQLSLGKINPDLFVTSSEMRDYLGY